MVLGNYEVDMIKYTGILLLESCWVSVCYMKSNRLEGRSVLWKHREASKTQSEEVCLCPPRPHALLLVSPVNRDEELLPGHVWKHHRPVCM